ncbi:fatty acyl-CoA reductase 1-like [Amphiura filiformis]|uniref:fatty acyl-CoA reductase 1-like n=1 Tax=Amphiura filiformis TaxID=82378 RepID=UPI003B20D9BD
MATIPEVYAGKSVLITGATGFIGKVLVEKLLRCCPDVKSLYLLVRPKAGQAPSARVEELVKCRLFEKLKSEQPNFEDKIIPVSSDMLEPKLGLNEENAKILQQNVNIVFHVAATIKFDEKLDLSLKLNVVTIQKMLQLCQGMKQLEVFVHVSTAYAHCDRTHIDEIVYPPPVDPYKLMNSTEWMSDEMITMLTPKIIGNRPNTYTFTKSIAEYVFVEEGAGLPLCIVRPSIVGATWKDPFPGWIDNFNGPSGLFIATGMGMLRAMIADADAVVDLSPVDYVVNMMIGAGWHTIVHKPSTVPIYNCVSSPTNPTRWRDVEDIPDYYLKTPLEIAFRRPNACITSHPWVFSYWNFIGCKIPCMVTDLYMKLTGKKARMVRLYDRIAKSMYTLKYFTQNDWEWSNRNCEALMNALPDTDRKVFFLDVRPLDWKEYLETYCVGTKQYVLNEDLAALPAAKRHIMKLRNIRWVFNTVVLVALWRVLIAKSELARNTWYLVLNLFFKFFRYFRSPSTSH